jgi:hypothetical protein
MRDIGENGDPCSSMSGGKFSLPGFESVAQKTPNSFFPADHQSSFPTPPNISMIVKMNVFVILQRKL